MGVFKGGHQAVAAHEAEGIFFGVETRVATGLARQLLHLRFLIPVVQPTKPFPATL